MEISILKEHKFQVVSAADTKNKRNLFELSQKKNINDMSQKTQI